MSVDEEKTHRTVEIAASIMTARDIDTILRMIVDAITDNFGFEACDAFILDEEHDNFVLKASKGFSNDIAERTSGLSKSRQSIMEDLEKSEKLGRTTYIFKAQPDENGSSYYSVLHPERVKEPRAHPNDWHELDVLYVVFQDSDGNLIGFLEPDGPISRKLPSPEVVSSLEMFGSLASIAIANAKLVTALNRTVKLFRALLDTTAAIQESADLKDTLKTIADRMNEMVPFDEISVYMVDWNRNLLIPIYATGPYVDEVLADIGPLTGLAGQVAKSGKVEIVEDSMDDPRVDDIPGIEDLEIRQTMMAIPLKTKQGVHGVLEVYREKSRKYTAVEVAVAEPFATHAAIAIENARLREELKKNYETVQEAYDETKDLDKMKDSLVDTISHELRTPLTTIHGYVEMAASGMYGDVTPKMQDKFKTILQQVNRINVLVSSMLEMSRLEKKTLELDFEPINMAMVTREVLEDVKNDIQAKSHTINVLFGNELPTVMADRVRIHDVIENLISNAVKYTPASGKITIGADILGGKVHLWVRDNGVGIAEEEQDKIFDRFFLADAGLVREDGRVGIGLYTSKEIIRRHGGDMWFESKKGQGSTFHFTVPFKQH